MPKLNKLIKTIRFSRYSNNRKDCCGSQAGARGAQPDLSGGGSQQLLPPPLPRDRGYDVCGFEAPKVFFITHFRHLDHCPAVTGVKLVYGEPIADQIDQYVSFYREERFNVELVEFKGEVIEGVHLVYVDRLHKYVEVTVCSYVLEDIKAMFIAEDCRANELLVIARERGLTSLFMEQPREHINFGYRLHASDIRDGYYLDPTTQKQYAPNIIPKCVPSIRDVKESPERWPNNEFARYFRSR